MTVFTKRAMYTIASDDQALLHGIRLSKTTAPEPLFTLYLEGPYRVSCIGAILCQTGPDVKAAVIRQSEPIPPVVVNSVEAVFNRLYTQWREREKFNSFIGASSDTGYEEMVQLGPAVVPYMIDRLKREAAHLFVALNRITGVDPVKKEHAGNTKKMAEDWIQWWEETGRAAG
jgi:hypothetical protein